MDIPADQLLGNAPYTGVNDLATGIELLPAGPDYYSWTLDIEYDFGTQAYSLAGPGTFFAINASTNGTKTQVAFNKGFIDGAGADSIVPMLRPLLSGSTVYYDMGSPLVLTTSTSANLTAGDGTIKVKIWYTARTFG